MEQGSRSSVAEPELIGTGAPSWLSFTSSLVRFIESAEGPLTVHRLAETALSPTITFTSMGDVRLLLKSITERVLPSRERLAADVRSW